MPLTRKNGFAASFFDDRFQSLTGKLAWILDSSAHVCACSNAYDSSRATDGPGYGFPHSGELALVAAWKLDAEGRQGDGAQDMLSEGLLSHEANAPRHAHGLIWTALAD